MDSTLLEHVARADFVPALERLRSLEPLDVNALHDERGNPILVLACLQVEEEEEPQADATGDGEASEARSEFVRELLALAAGLTRPSAADSAQTGQDP